MRPDDYCAEQAAPPGSSLHYALLGESDARRRAVIALHALARALDAIGASDVNVTAAKLDWWRDELIRLFDDRPRHPTTRALSEHRRALALPREPFDALLQAAAETLRYNAFADDAALQRYCHLSGASLALLRARALGFDHAGTADFAHELGVALRRLRLLARVRDDARVGRFFIPDADLAAHGVDHAELAGGGNSAALRALFAAQAGRIRNGVGRAERVLPDGDRYRQRAQLAYAALKLAWLDEAERDGFQLLRRRVALTPLRKLWLASRARWRQRRYRAAAARADAAARG